MLATIYNFISIHAPPRGATSSELRRVARSRNFNSRPSARGDSDVAVFVNILSDFNSRPSARGDDLGALLVRQLIISIHAPPRGATSRRRRDPEPRHFNSRPSARGDNTLIGIPYTKLISIHAPPRGATTARSQHSAFILFQFTPLREGRRVVARRTCAKSNFNSRPSARGDTMALSRYTATIVFQFTPLREGRQISITPNKSIEDFNSRPSARGDTVRNAV